MANVLGPFVLSAVSGCSIDPRGGSSQRPISEGTPDVRLAISLQSVTQRANGSNEQDRITVKAENAGNAGAVVSFSVEALNATQSTRYWQEVHAETPGQPYHVQLGPKGNVTIVIIADLTKFETYEIRVVATYVGSLGVMPRVHSAGVPIPIPQSTVRSLT